MASLFPGTRAGERADGGRASAARPSRRPTRISLTLPAIRAAREVWLLAAGEDKADAVASALSGSGELQAPAAAARGRDRTLWLLDDPAAAKRRP